jgi:spoIIIJ-associated protein
VDSSDTQDATGNGDVSAGGAPERDYLDEQADAAEDFLNGLLDELDMDGEAEADIVDDSIAVRLEGDDFAVLIGRGGVTLDALQDLTRAAVHTKTGERAILTLDIGGYRDRQRTRLEERAKEIAESVRSTGAPVSLEPMSSYERLIVHQALANEVGITTSSSGEEPDRFVVVSPS